MSKIIVITDGINTEYWSKLTLLCQKKTGFSYHYLKGLKFPFKYKGVEFDRFEINEDRGVEVNPDATTGRKVVFKSFDRARQFLNELKNNPSE